MFPTDTAVSGARSCESPIRPLDGGGLYQGISPAPALDNGQYSSRRGKNNLAIGRSA
jgi:hypothetical protein